MKKIIVFGGGQVGSSVAKILSDDGVLVIEDVQSINWINELKMRVPDHLQEFIEVYDLRRNKNRYDDIMFVINKNKNKK